MTSSSLSGRSVASQKINHRVRGSGGGSSSSGRSTSPTLRKGPKSGSPGGRKVSASPKRSGHASSTTATCANLLQTPGKSTNQLESETDVEDIFEDHSLLGNRIKKTLYYGGHLPSTPRPSFPLTVFAVNAFTSGTLGTELDTLEFLDLDMASEIGRNACVSPTVVIMALVYLDRLAKSNPKYLSSVKPSELFVVALLVASKFIQDDGEQYGVYNGDWATPLFDKNRLNKLEINFLSALDWNVKVDLEEFYATLNGVEQALCFQESGRRSGLTYTELYSLSSSGMSWESLWPILYTYIFQVVTIACISYVTLLATLMTSCILTPELIGLSRNLLTTTLTDPTNTSSALFHGQTQPTNAKYFVHRSDPTACHAPLISWLENDSWTMTETEMESYEGIPSRNKTNHIPPGLLQAALRTSYYPPIIATGKGTLHYGQNHQFTLTTVTIK